MPGFSNARHWLQGGRTRCATSCKSTQEACEGQLSFGTPIRDIFIIAILVALLHFVTTMTYHDHHHRHHHHHHHRYFHIQLHSDLNRDEKSDMIKPTLEAVRRASNLQRRQDLYPKRRRE